MLSNISSVNSSAANVPASYAGSSSTTTSESSNSKSSSNEQTSDSPVNMNNQVSNPPKSTSTVTETSGLVISQIINVATSNISGIYEENSEETENQIPSVESIKSATTAKEISPSIQSQTSTQSSVLPIPQICNGETNYVSETEKETPKKAGPETQVTCDLSIEIEKEVAPGEQSTENQTEPEGDDSLLDSDENCSSSCDSAYQSAESRQSPAQNDPKTICTDKPATENGDIIIITSNNISGTTKEIPEKTASADTQVTCDLSVEIANEVAPDEQLTEIQKEPEGDKSLLDNNLLSFNQSVEHSSSSCDSSYQLGESCRSLAQNDPKTIRAVVPAADNGDKYIDCSFTRNAVSYDDITYDITADDTIISIEDSIIESESIVNLENRDSSEKSNDFERNLNTFRSAKLFSKAIKELVKDKTNDKSLVKSDHVSKRGNKNYLSIDHYHVLLHLTESVGFYGNMSIKLLTGSASVAGYILDVDESVTAHAPVGHSAISIVPNK